jgi:hypothetical protein
LILLVTGNTGVHGQVLDPHWRLSAFADVSMALLALECGNSYMASMRIKDVCGLSKELLPLDRFSFTGQGSNLFFLRTLGEGCLVTEHAGIDGRQAGKGFCFYELVATCALQILVGQVVELNGLLDLFPE